MTGLAIPVVLIPRFTGYVGDGIYDSNPIDVTQYESAALTLWRGAPIGTLSSLAVSCHESTDLDTWSLCTGGALSVPPAGNQEQSKVTFAKQWMRTRVILIGTDPGVTVWLQGYFVRRKE